MEAPPKRECRDQPRRLHMLLFEINSKTEAPIEPPYSVACRYGNSSS